MRAFASDNYAGVLPEALDGIAAVNTATPSPTAPTRPPRASRRSMRESSAPDARVFPVFNGTGANVVGLRAMLRPWQGVICAESAHLNVDEGGAPEVMGGIKLLTVADAGRQAHARAGGHAGSCGSATSTPCSPGVVSVTQSTELGTLYTLEELRALGEHAHAHGMLFHIDGSRLANAAASLGVRAAGDHGRRRRRRRLARRHEDRRCSRPRRSSCCNPELAPSLLYLRKQSMQLASKMRFVSAQLLALLRGRRVAPRGRERERDGGAAGRRRRREQYVTERVEDIDNQLLVRLHDPRVWSLFPRRVDRRLGTSLANAGGSIGAETLHRGKSYVASAAK